LNNKVTVKIKKLHPDAVIPQYAHKSDAGFDLVAVEDVIIEPGETKAIPLGWPLKYRKGTKCRYGKKRYSGKTKLRVSNAPGTVDCTYRAKLRYC